MSAAEIVKALSGRRSGGGWICRCPVLGHGKGRGDQNPSLSVGDGDDGRLLLNCKAGCGFEEILGELKRRGLVDGRPSQGPTRMIRGSAPAVHEPDATALGLWQTAKHAEDPGSYAVREYLARRGIPFPPPSIRCGSFLHLGRYDLPTMVAAVQRPDGAVVAAQLTKLTTQGQRAPVSTQKLTHGALGSGAFRGGPAGEILGIAEGVESALSAQIMTGISCWASLGAARLHRVELPPIVKEVHVFADADDPGREAADRTAKVHLDLGRRVVLRFPPAGRDYNDLLNLDADERFEDIVRLPEQGVAA